MDYENFTFLGNWREMYETIPDDKMKKEFIEALINYGTAYEVPDSQQNPLIYVIMSPIMASIDKAKDNYSNGSKGGRPITYSQEDFNILFEQGKTNKEVEQITGASHSTVERKKKNWKMSQISAEDYENEEEQEKEEEERGYEEDMRVLRGGKYIPSQKEYELGFYQ